MTKPDWIAAERRESRLRIWQMAADGTVLAQTDCIAEGGEDLARTLGHALPGLDAGTPVVVSGAARLPFAAVPCSPPKLAQAQRDGVLHRLPAWHSSIRSMRCMARRPGWRAFSRSIRALTA